MKSAECRFCTLQSSFFHSERSRSLITRARRFERRRCRWESCRECQYTGTLLRPEEGSLDHVVPRSRGGPDAWENLVWAAKNVNQRKGNRLPHEAGLKLLTVPRAPKEVPVTALIRHTPGIDDWKLFLG